MFPQYRPALTSPISPSASFRRTQRRPIGFCRLDGLDAKYRSLLWLTREVLPLVQQHLPQCTLTIAGSRPSASIRALAADCARVRVTGTVDFACR
jgi:hypothetical protein